MQKVTPGLFLCLLPSALFLQLSVPSGTKYGTKMKNKRNVFFCFLILFVSSFSPVFSGEKNINKDKLPFIPYLSSRDDIFKEYSAVVDENYQLLSAGEEPLMIFFKCKVPEDTSLISLAARCNIPYETLATLNHIESNARNLSGKEMVLPTVPGLFIETGSQDALQVILRTRCFEILQNDNMCYNFGTQKFVFLTNQRFTPTERAYFLDTSLGLPIDTALSWISSSFGRRKNPFSGEWKTHKGVDFAAETGTPVMAVQSGTVSLIKNDPTFGNYIIIKHRNGDATSVYAHLSSFKVKNGQQVNRGDVIGYVGETGMVTGPHLHFEIRFGGIAEDPEKLLPVKKRQ